jgi:hypothetical protein
VRRPATLTTRKSCAGSTRAKPLDAYDERRMADQITREELVRCLAEVSHKSWIKQKVRDYGAVESDLSTDVHEHDLERAEDTVEELERLELWPR